MELKCIFIKNDSRMPKVNLSDDVLSNILSIKIKKLGDSEIKETAEISGIIVFRINRKGNAERYGVNSSLYKEDVPLNQELGKPILIQDFILVDTKESMVYYTGTKISLENILLKYFNLREEHMKSIVSLADVSMIAKIKVIEYPIGHSSIFASAREMQREFELDDIFGSSDPFVKSFHEYELRDANKFKRINLEKLLNANKDNELRKYSFEGTDVNGNPINYSDGILAKKIILFENGSHKGYEERKKMSLIDLVKEFGRIK